MKRKILYVFLIAVCVSAFSSCSKETSREAKELIEKNINARGGYEKISAVKSLRVTSKYLQQGRETEVVLMLKRPNLLYTEVRFPGGPMLSWHDGKTTWWYHEHKGHTTPQEIPPEMALIVSRYAEFGDCFMNYEQKGQTIEYLGTEDLSGKKAHKLKIAMKHGIQHLVYLDTETFLIVKDSFIAGKKTGKDSKLEIHTVYSDFREVGGVMFPFHHDIGPEQTVVQNIDINVDLDDSLFKVPKKIKKRKKLTMAQFEKELDTYLEKSAKEDVFSGTVLVAKAGKVILKKAYGRADREHKILNTPDTRFCIGSINKTFTTVAVAQLVEQSKLAYDDVIGKYLGADWIKPEVGRKVTVSHLLTHTSGLDEYLTDERLGIMMTTDHYKTIIKNLSLHFEPGSKWEYCNTGYILLGAVIGKVSGQDYETYIGKHIFEPAGMKRTFIFSMAKDVADVAVPYAKTGARGSASWKKTNLAGKLNGSAAGGGFSTVEDLFKFADALKANRLISGESSKLLMSPKPGLNSPGYGYGFIIFNHPRLGTIIGHGGSAPGVSANFRMCVGIGYTAIILSNHDKQSLPAWGKVKSLLPLK